MPILVCIYPGSLTQSCAARASWEKNLQRRVELLGPGTVDDLNPDECHNQGALLSQLKALSEVTKHLESPARANKMSDDRSMHLAVKISFRLYKTTVSSLTTEAENSKLDQASPKTFSELRMVLTSTECHIGSQGHRLLKSACTAAAAGAQISAAFESETFNAWPWQGTLRLETQ
jgi:hypothetical protein